MGIRTRGSGIAKGQMRFVSEEISEYISILRNGNYYITEMSDFNEDRRKVSCLENYYYILTILS